MLTFHFKAPTNLNISFLDPRHLFQMLITMTVFGKVCVDKSLVFSGVLKAVILLSFFDIFAMVLLVSFRFMNFDCPLDIFHIFFY